MAHVVDVRRSGGDFVILGQALVLPTSVDPQLSGGVPMLGSIRYNPAGYVELYAPDTSGIPSWGVISANGPGGGTIGGTVVDDLNFGELARIVLDTGTVDRPSLTFQGYLDTGISVSDAVMRLGSMGTAGIEIFPGSVNFPVGLTATTISATSASFDIINTVNLSAPIMTTGHLGTATLAATEAATINELYVVPTDVASTQLPVMIMTVGSNNWTVKHASNNELWVSYNDSPTIVMKNDGRVQANLEGTADHALTSNRWLNARTITLGGDLTGNVSFDGSSDFTLTATIAANAVALGIDTTGNYVGSVAVSGLGLSIANTGTEGGTFTITSNATDANTGSTLVFRDASGSFSAGTITATLSGNATTSSRLATARNIALSGDVTGSASFDGSTNVTIATTMAPLTIVAETNANRDLVAGDKNALIRMNNAGANTVTVPTNATVPFGIGTQINVIQIGDGQTSFVAAAGVTINTPETLKLRKKFSSALLVKVGTDEWDLMGDLEIV